jgi:hypothetical protein
MPAKRLGHKQKSDLAHPESDLPPEPDIKRFVALVGCRRWAEIPLCLDQAAGDFNLRGELAKCNLAERSSRSGTRPKEQNGGE